MKRERRERTRRQRGEEDEEEKEVVENEGQEQEQEEEEEEEEEEKVEEEEDEEEAAAEEDGSVDGGDSFAALGLSQAVCEAAARQGWSAPTDIQRKAVPAALEGRDVIGLAETGSGKTGAFALPILHDLLTRPQRLFAVILSPTRELALQIHDVFSQLGAAMSLQCCAVVGGIDSMTQAIALAKKPHVIVATPGRLVDHLENTKGFNLRHLKYLVLDEADRMLSMDFEEEINKILAVIPREERTTFLFSATMTSKVAKLQRASLTDPVKVEVSSKFQTPKTLIQQYVFLPAKHKDCYLTFIVNEFAGQSTLVFVEKCATAQRLALVLRHLGFGAVCLHGQMSQPARIGALNRFKAGERAILVATDVASRGLDIPAVDLVINFDVPGHGKDYIHRVGRTARAGRTGRSIAMVTQYDVEAFQRLEALIGQRLPAFPAEPSTVLILLERVSEAQRLATREIREMDASGRGGGGGARGGRRAKRRGQHSGDGDGEGARDGDGAGDDEDQHPRARVKRQRKNGRRR